MDFPFLPEILFAMSMLVFSITLYIVSPFIKSKIEIKSGHLVVKR